MAKAEKEKDTAFRQEIRNKRQKKAELIRKAVELEKKKPFDKNVFELYSLISGKIVIQQESLSKTFRIIKKEVEELLGTLCREKGFPHPILVKTPETDLKTDSQESDKDDMYEAVDLVLQYSGRNAEPELYEYGKTLLEQFDTEQYNRVPDIAELAVNEGYIKNEDMEKASIELATRRKDEPSLSMDQIGRAHV